MARYRAMIEIDLSDDENDPNEVTVIEEGVFQAVTSLLEEAGYVVEGFKSIVLFQGDTND